MDDADASDWVRVRSGDPAALGVPFGPATTGAYSGRRADC